MAKALQCPSCGTKTRLDTVDGSGTFSCASCGQVLKTPPGLSGRTAPAAGGASAGSGPAAPAPPVPPRRARPVVTAGAGAPAGGTAVIAPPPAPARATVAPPLAASAARAPSSRPARETLPLWLRILIWVVALPLALLIVGIPARRAGFLSSQKLLDVIVKHDIGRYVPILVIIVLWALATAILVTVFVEGGRRLMERRRRRAHQDAGPGDGRDSGQGDDLAFANASAAIGGDGAPAPPPPKRRRTRS